MLSVFLTSGLGWVFFPLPLRSLLRDALPENFRQRTFGFGRLCPVVVFFGVVLLMFS